MCVPCFIRNTCVSILSNFMICGDSRGSKEGEDGDEEERVAVELYQVKSPHVEQGETALRFPFAIF